MSDSGLFGHLTRLQHVNIPSTDLARSREFYVEKLGLPVLPRPAFESPGVWVGAGPENAIHISGVANLGPNPNNHFALEVEDLDGLLDALDAQGVAFQRSAYVPAAGRQAFLSDPDGNVIELNQPPT
ncbi:MAG: VOC family protein [bacterium]|nr:VOC family protein [Acidimicrobiia bacterium]MCY4650375.1 VOC family protein [bacterium]